MLVQSKHKFRQGELVKILPPSGIEDREEVRLLYELTYKNRVYEVYDSFITTSGGEIVELWLDTKKPRPDRPPSVLKFRSWYLERYGGIELFLDVLEGIKPIFV